MEDTKTIIHKGSVKFYQASQGFGFISVDGGKNVFLHISDVVDGDFQTLFSRGERVEFEIEQTTKGLRARHVKRVV